MEQCILNAARKGWLHTYIICPGILYGAGEHDTHLHSLFKAAWEATTPLPVYGHGRNHIPLLHVADLAGYVMAAAEQLPDQQYLLACDDQVLTQQELVRAVGAQLNHTKSM